MEPGKKDEMRQEIDLLGSEAVGVLRKFLSLGEFTPRELDRARVAQSAFSGWTRVKQADNQRESNLLLLIRELAENKAQFREFVKVALPNAPLPKALPTKK